MDPHQLPQAFLQNDHQILEDQQFIIAPQEHYDAYNDPQQQLMPADGNYIELNGFDPTQSQTIYIQADGHPQQQPEVQYVDPNMIPIQQFDGNPAMGEAVFNEYMDNAVHLDDGSGICYVTMTQEEFDQQQLNQGQPMYYEDGQMEQLQYIPEDQMNMQQVQMQQMMPMDMNMQQMVDPNMQQMPIEYVMDNEYQPMQVVYNQADNILAEGIDFDSPEDMERRLEEAYAAEGKEVDYIVPEDLERAGFTVNDFDSLTDEQLNVVLELKRHFEAHEKANLEEFERNKERLEAESREREAKRARMAANSAMPLSQGRKMPKAVTAATPEVISVNENPSTSETTDHEPGPSTSQPRRTRQPEPEPKRRLYKDVVTFGHLRILDDEGREYFFSKKELLKIGIDPSTISDDALNDLYEKAIADRLAAANPQVEVIDPPEPPPKATEEDSDDVIIVEGFKIGDPVMVADDDKEFEATIRYKKITATGNLFKVQYTHGRFEWVDESRISRKPAIPEVLVPRDMVVAAKVLDKPGPSTVKPSQPGPSKAIQRPKPSSSATSESSTVTRGPPIPTKSPQKRAAVKLIQNQRAGESGPAPKPRLRKRLHPKPTTSKPTSAPSKPGVKFNCLPCGKTVTQPAYSFLVIRIPACVDCAKRTIAVNDVRNLETALNGACNCNCQKPVDNANANGNL
uniref:Chromo domain-containing protein n=1 Tax=Panagrellus redivivus TaxID=6233 RepID=A0A7E4USN1_PANRE